MLMAEHTRCIEMVWVASRLGLVPKLYLQDIIALCRSGRYREKPCSTQLLIGRACCRIACTPSPGLQASIRKPALGIAFAYSWILGNSDTIDITTEYDKVWPVMDEQRGNSATTPVILVKSYSTLERKAVVRKGWAWPAYHSHTSYVMSASWKRLWRYPEVSAEEKSRMGISRPK